MDGGARAEAIELVAGEDDGAVAGKTDEFAARAVFVTETNGGAKAQGLARAGGFDAQAFKRGDPALMFAGVERFDVPDGRSQHVLTPDVNSGLKPSEMSSGAETGFRPVNHKKPCRSGLFRLFHNNGIRVTFMNQSGRAETCR